MFSGAAGQAGHVCCQVAMLSLATNKTVEASRHVGPAVADGEHSCGRLPRAREPVVYIGPAVADGEHSCGRLPRFHATPHCRSTCPCPHLRTCSYACFSGRVCPACPRLVTTSEQGRHGRSLLPPTVGYRPCRGPIDGTPWLLGRGCWAVAAGPWLPGRGCRAVAAGPRLLGRGCWAVAAASAV